MIGRLFGGLVLGCAAIAAVGWLVYVGSYGYRATQLIEAQSVMLNGLQILEIEGHRSAPYYITAVFSPILILLMILMGILLMVIPQKTVIHAIFASVSAILYPIVIGFAAIALHFMAIFTAEVIVSNESRQIYGAFLGFTNAALAGTIIEVLFLAFAFLFAVLSYLFRETEKQ